MLDINLIRKNPDLVRAGVAKKNVDPKLVDKFLRLDEAWRSRVTLLDHLKSEQNNLNKELGKTRTKDLLSRAQILKKRVSQIEKEVRAAAEKRDEVLRYLPNLPQDDVPVGKDESENRVLREVGEKLDFSAKGGSVSGWKPKDYLELGEKLDLIDVKRASKSSGSRFGYLKREAVLMEFGLVKLAFDVLVKDGFIPVIPPVMIKGKMMAAMGYIDKKSDWEETYFLDKDDLYLVGTSEQSIGPMHADEVLSEEELPKRYVSFSTCFRREAGSYGKDTRGILRVHQFDKVEMFSFCHPEKSREEHKFLLSLQEKLMKMLNLPYRVLEICTGDLGQVAASKFDIEAWFPSEGRYRETHSTSNVTDFQARRLNVKFQPKNKKEKPAYVHTLNGTAFSQRPILAILENFQTNKGTVKIPEVLQEYVGKEEIGR